ncbi:hypothetical protein BCE75_10322 [Isoptericola sp. CG 20/1183]|uniref:PRC-barrel domain protein n=1 Tax=Isoptericola halotolerans TaxID=300560 RepID=A0ABX5EHE2_9MICO|nr:MULTISPECIES: hypothetical protein [Isoptericola]MCK0116281.1 hypothetical protein [Isoptericola sp. S6320L]PRZ08097.1 hypothetical protein BCL65_10322 [Isoptericola halotolerans]PRZ08895.1 hypothetical protein BCE75_10322 [Isoptericola sp. CG 20/1183]
MTDFAGPEGPIRHVTEGMRVVDVEGETVGKVEAVRMGDAGATTSSGQGMDSGADDPLSLLADAFGAGTQLDEHTQERLLRIGFLRVDAKGVFTGDRYVEADQIADVVDDEVRLSVPKDRLAG